MWFHWGLCALFSAITGPVCPPHYHGFVLDTTAEIKLLYSPRFCLVFNNSVPVPAARPGNESSLWGPQLWVHIQGFPLPFSGQLGATRSPNADMLPITQPQLLESHPGRLFPRWRHGICGLGLLSTSDWHYCSHLQHQHRSAMTRRLLNLASVKLKTGYGGTESKLMVTVIVGYLCSYINTIYLT